MTMRNILILAIILIAGLSESMAQIRFDIVGGVSPVSRSSSAGVLINRMNPHEEFVFNVVKVDPQFFIGGKANLELSTPFFANVGLLYSKRNSTYHAAYTIIDAEHPQPDYYMEETEHILMLPVNVGVNIGPLDVTSGLRVMKTAARKSGLDQIAGFTYTGKPIQLGWQAGIGYSLFRTRLGVEYQSTFSRVGNSMMVHDQSLELMNIPGQFVFNIQRSF